MNEFEVLGMCLTEETIGIQEFQEDSSSSG
jgi:hypothetical protein